MYYTAHKPGARAGDDYCVASPAKHRAKVQNSTSCNNNIGVMGHFPSHTQIYIKLIPT